MHLDLEEDCAQPFLPVKVTELSTFYTSLVYNDYDTVAGVDFTFYNRALDSAIYIAWRAEHAEPFDSTLVGFTYDELVCLTSMSRADACSIERIDLSSNFSSNQSLESRDERPKCYEFKSNKSKVAFSVRWKNFWRGVGSIFGGSGGGRTNSGAFHGGWGYPSGALSGGTWSQTSLTPVRWDQIQSGVPFSYDHYYSSLSGSREFRCRLWECGISGGQIADQRESDGCASLPAGATDEDSDVDYCASIRQIYSCLSRSQINNSTIGVVESLLLFNSDIANSPIEFAGHFAVEAICNGTLDFDDYRLYHEAAARSAAAEGCIKDNSFLSYEATVNLYAPETPVIGSCSNSSASPGVNALIMMFAANATSSSCESGGHNVVGCDGRTLEEIVRSSIASIPGGVCVDRDGQFPVDEVYNAIWDGLTNAGVNVAQARYLVAQTLSIDVSDLNDVVNCSGLSGSDVSTILAAQYGCNGVVGDDAILSVLLQPITSWVNRENALSELNADFSEEELDYIRGASYDCSVSFREFALVQRILYHCESNPEMCNWEADQSTQLLPFVSGYLSCSSFDFQLNSSGEGQTACVNGIKFSHAGIPSPNYCLSITVPSNGISALEAQDCADLMFNRGAKTAMTAYLLKYNAGQPSRPVDWSVFYASFFKPAILAMSTSTDCGYAAVVNCNDYTPLPYPTFAEWHSGWWDYFTSPACND